jgi:hypothetical protein
MRPHIYTFNSFFIKRNTVTNRKYSLDGVPTYTYSNIQRMNSRNLGSLVTKPSARDRRTALKVLLSSPKGHLRKKFIVFVHFAITCAQHY